MGKTNGFFSEITWLCFLIQKYYTLETIIILNYIHFKEYNEFINSVMQKIFPVVYLIIRILDKLKSLYLANLS